jgi:hypothetical protein
LSVGKRDILVAQQDACEKLLKYTMDRSNRLAIELEIMELDVALELLP